MPEHTAKRFFNNFRPFLRYHLVGVRSQDLLGFRPFACAVRRCPRLVISCNLRGRGRPTAFRSPGRPLAPCYFIQSLRNQSPDFVLILIVELLEQPVVSHGFVVNVSREELAARFARVNVSLSVLAFAADLLVTTVPEAVIFALTNRPDRPSRSMLNFMSLS